ncbi:tRNA 2'-phosphotransferase 1 [Massospora cicadina]|nr:tRNA 2'-phosphotransferase 1 [Massospora cicadina]
MDSPKEFAKLSHKLSKFLRHEMKLSGINSPLTVTDLFKRYTLDAISQVVDLDAKNRYDLKQGIPYAGGFCNMGARSFPEPPHPPQACTCWWIRANQGHSFELPDPGFEPILDPTEFTNVIHGTYLETWREIAFVRLLRSWTSYTDPYGLRDTNQFIVDSGGLKPMGRAYIHFASGLPGETGVMSGLRKSAEVLIYIDLAAALRVVCGLQAMRSKNQVILSPGVGAPRSLPLQYFSRVVTLHGNALLPAP